MVRKNLGIAFFLSKRYAEAELEFMEAMNSHQSIREERCGHNAPTSTLNVCENINRSELFVLHKLYTLRRSTAKWESWESVTDILTKSSVTTAIEIIQQNGLQNSTKYSVGEQRIAPFFDGPFLPFDTLSVDMTHEERFLIARAFALNFAEKREVQVSIPHISDVICLAETRPKTDHDHHKMVIPKLRLGFMSFDFNEHPTAQMVEGLFRVMSSYNSDPDKSGIDPTKDVRRFVHTTILSYGKDDGSEMRRILEQLPDEYVELAHMPHRESRAEIQRRNLSVLLDMQVILSSGLIQVSPAQSLRIYVFLLHQYSTRYQFKQKSSTLVEYLQPSK